MHPLHLLLFLLFLLFEYFSLVSCQLCMYLSHLISFCLAFSPHRHIHTMHIFCRLLLHSMLTFIFPFCCIFSLSNSTHECCFLSYFLSINEYVSRCTLHNCIVANAFATDILAILTVIFSAFVISYLHTSWK